jgi:hypothetical protein
MSPEREASESSARADREEPVGEPVVRADPAVTGERAAEAVEFDPDDEASVAEAADVVASFATDSVGDEDQLYVLRGAAACAALVRGVGSYKAAAARAGDGVTVSFVRKWARVHDLPQAVRRHVARGDVPPTAAKHVARVDGEARFALAWGVLDGGLTVREVRAVASEVNEGRDPAAALEERGVDPGRLELSLSPATYAELRRRASLADESPGDVVDAALAAYFD